MLGLFVFVTVLLELEAQVAVLAQVERLLVDGVVNVLGLIDVGGTGAGVRVGVLGSTRVQHVTVMVKLVMRWLMVVALEQMLFQDRRLSSSCGRCCCCSYGCCAEEGAGQLALFLVVVVVLFVLLLLVIVG